MLFQSISHTVYIYIDTAIGCAIVGGLVSFIHSFIHSFIPLLVHSAGDIVWLF
jgi:hypothetical protein